MNKKTLTDRETYQYSDTGDKVKLQVGTDPKFSGRLRVLEFKKIPMHSSLGLATILDLC